MSNLLFFEIWVENGFIDSLVKALVALTHQIPVYGRWSKVTETYPPRVKNLMLLAVSYWKFFHGSSDLARSSFKCINYTQKVNFVCHA